MRLARLAVLCTALVALSAAPALAQDAIATDGETARGADVQIVDCSQVINIVQGQYGDADAIGRRAVAVVANEQGITVNQVNACLGNIGGNGGGEETTDEETTEEESTEETTEETSERERSGEETTVVDGQTILIPKGVAAAELPDTGGPTGGGFVLAAGCALLGVGLILNRIVR